jgi:tetratricopeptide (TPR) repeat protein
MCRSGAARTSFRSSPCRWTARSSASCDSFEHPEDVNKLEKRRHLTVFTDDLGPLLRDHRIPLVFLEACQTALAEKASESVASELLKVGVASVVAMSHSVLVETARRFVEAFYEALAGGARVGDAMLEGQLKLKDDTFRGRIFGAGELRLEDWFVPVLFQEKEDPQLFRATTGKQTREDLNAALANRLGELPAQPETGFIGRSRELLALERLLRHDRYAVVRGQGGEGKTDHLGRTEEAVAFLRQAADKCVENDAANEGRLRNNLGATLYKLRRVNEARQELYRAIECKEQFGHAVEPWKSWAILSDIERDAGNPAAAAEARRKAVERYLAYRRDGGENHNGDGRLSLAVTQHLLAGDAAAAASLLLQVAVDPNLPTQLRPFIEALQAIVAGSRDRALADSRDFDYTMAAEILFLIETLEKER